MHHDPERVDDALSPLHLTSPAGAPGGLTVTWDTGRVEHFGTASAAEAVGALFYFQATTGVTEVVLGRGAPCASCAGTGTASAAVFEDGIMTERCQGGCPRCAGTGFDPDPAAPMTVAEVAR